MAPCDLSMSLLVAFIILSITFQSKLTSASASSSSSSSSSPRSYSYAPSSLSQLCNVSFPECCQQFASDLQYNSRYTETTWYHSLDGECCILARFSYCINRKSTLQVFSAFTSHRKIKVTKEAEECQEITKKLYKNAECDDHSVTYPSLYCTAFYNSHIFAFCLLSLMVTTCFYCCFNMCTNCRKRDKSSQYTLLKVPVANVDRYVSVNQPNPYSEKWNHCNCKQSKCKSKSTDDVIYTQPLMGTQGYPISYNTSNH